MAYVVVVCSRCRAARGVSEGQKTATCPGCGRKLRVPELKKYHRSESLSETAEAVGHLNARLRGGLEAYLGDLASSRGSAPAVRAGRPPAGERPLSGAEGPPAGGSVSLSKLDQRILITLEKEGALSCGDLLPALGLKCSEFQLYERLEALRRAGLLYEPAPGRYALVR